MWKRIFRRKYILRGLLILFVLLIGLIAATPYLLYRNQQLVSDMVLSRLNKAMIGHTTLGGVHISPFKNFPYISIDLENLKFYDTEDESHPPIYEFEDVYLGFDIWDIFKGEYTVKKVRLSKGKLHIIRYKDGTINLLLAKSMKEQAEDEEADGDPLHLDLQEIILDEVSLEKEDEITKQHILIHFTKVSSGFKYIDTFIDNHLEANFEIRDMKVPGLGFFKKKHFHISSDLHYNMQKNFLEIRPSKFEMEGGLFEAEGSVDLAKNAYLDIKVKGRKPDFKLITSFAPDYVYERLQSYKNEGDVYFTGKIVGATIDDNPKIDFKFGCKNANFINPNSSKSLKDLNFTGYFTNGKKRNLSTSELFLQNLSGKSEESVFKGSFHIKNFVNPYISVDLHSNLELESLYELFEVEALKGLSGKMMIDMTIDELLDYNDVAGTLGKLKDGSDSKIILKDVNYKLIGYPHTIKDINAELDFVAGELLIKYFNAKIKKSDFSLKGGITNLSAFLHGEDANITAKLTGKAKKIDLAELLSFDPKLVKNYNDAITDLRFNFHFDTNSKYLKRADGIPEGEFFIDELFFKLKNYKHDFHDFYADILIDKEDINIKKFSGVIDKSDLNLLGHLKNYHALLPKHEAKPVELYFDFTSKYLNFDDLLTYNKANYLPEEYKHETLEDLEIESTLRANSKDILKGDWLRQTDINLTDVHCKFRQHPLKLREIHGDFQLRNGQLNINNFVGKLGQSDFKINGTLSNYFGKKDEQKIEKVTLVANTLNFDEIFTYDLEASNNTDTKPKPNKPIDHDAGFNLFEIPFPEMELLTEIGNIKYRNTFLQNFKGKFRTKTNHYFYIDNLDFDAAGGHTNINGYFNGSDPTHIYFSSTIDTKDTDIDKIFYKFDNFGQDYLLKDNIHGRLTAKVTSKVRLHTDLVVNLKETEAHIDATIKDGSLVNFAPFEMMSSYVGDKDLNNVQFAEISNTFDVKDGTISILRMEIATTLGYFFISGKKTFDLQMDYIIEVPFKLVKQATWNMIFKKKKNKDKEEQEVEEEIIRAREDGREVFVKINITGTPSDYEIRLGKGKKNRKKNGI